MNYLAFAAAFICASGGFVNLVWGHVGSAAESERSSTMMAYGFSFAIMFAVLGCFL